MNLDRHIKKLNATLKRELGNPLQHIEGTFAWMHSNDQALRIAVPKGRVAVEDPTTGLVNMKMEYNWRSILPDLEEYRNIWLVCHSNHRIPYAQWRAIFQDSLPEECYWRPVQYDASLEILAGRTGSNLCGYVCTTPGVLPTEQDTLNFIESIKEARALQEREIEGRNKLIVTAEQHRHAELKAEIRDRFRAFYGKPFISVPGAPKLVS